MNRIYRMLNNLKLIPLLICSILPLEGIRAAGDFPQLTLHSPEFKEPYQISGKDCAYGTTFEAPFHVSCACFVGLWAFYDNSCNGPNRILGAKDERCVRVDGAVEKVHLLSSPSSGAFQTASVFQSGMRRLMGRLEGGRNATGSLGFSPLPGRAEFVLSSGSVGWTLSPGSACMGQQPPGANEDNYCFYRMDFPSSSEVQLQQSGCNSEDGVLLRKTVESCTPYIAQDSVECSEFVPKTLLSASIEQVKKGRGIGRKVAATNETTTEVGNTATTTTTAAPQTTKEAATTKPTKPPKKSSKGGSKNKTETKNPKGRSASKGNETAAATTTTTTKAPVKTTTTKAPKTVSESPPAPEPKPKQSAKGRGGGILEKKPKSSRSRGRTFLRNLKNLSFLTVTYQFPTYHEDGNITVNISNFDISSQIWNYLTDEAIELLNLTTRKPVTTLSPTFGFLDLSKRILQKACPAYYVKPTHFDLALQTFIYLQKKYLRFNDAFSDYPAKQRIEDSLQLCLQEISPYPFVDPMNSSMSLSTCNETVELGTFENFGQRMELNVSYESSTRGKEPLIESVWKIFTHAHAACYKYFEESGFNDHHRFTSIMMPVFTNGIQEIWKSIGNVTEDTYAGILGEDYRLMDAVTYCAEYAKLGTDYPWELPRPEKEVQRRKKRTVATSSKPIGRCLKESFDNSCSGSVTVENSPLLPPDKPTEGVKSENRALTVDE